MPLGTTLQFSLDPLNAIPSSYMLLNMPGYWASAMHRLALLGLQGLPPNAESNNISCLQFESKAYKLKRRITTYYLQADRLHLALILEIHDTTIAAVVYRSFPKTAGVQLLRPCDQICTDLPVQRKIRKDKPEPSNPETPIPLN